jgi:hypothetical protein
VSTGRRGLRTLGVVVGAGAFVALLAWTTLRQQGAVCRVCMSIDGRVQCSKVAAADRDDAMRGAIQTACGTLSTSVTNELACQRETPQSVECRP